MRTNRLFATALTLIILLAGCGDGGDPSGPGGGGGGGTTLPNGTFSGTVNGSNFRVVSAFVTYSGNIVAMGAADTQGRGFGWAVIATAPGTYPIQGSIGNNAIWTEASSGWAASAATAGSSGSVTLTTLTPTRAVGSFQFTLVPSSGNASGNRTVSGSFDLTIQGGTN